jgi:superfamily II DNA helicase RecQ
MRKLIEMDKNARSEVKKIHYDNLRAMVGYCENTSDCRRAIQVPNPLIRELRYKSVQRNN